MPATSCWMAIPKFWPLPQPGNSSGNSNASWTWWPAANSPNAPNDDPIHAKYGAAAPGSQADKRRKLSDIGLPAWPTAPAVVPLLGRTTKFRPPDSSLQDRPDDSALDPQCRAVGRR